MNKLLVISSTSFLLPISYALYQYHNLTITQYILAGLLFCNCIISCTFWFYPIRHSVINKIDSFFAKMSFIFYSIYILVYHNISLSAKFLFILILHQSIKQFKNSGYYSRCNWCCNEHIFYHFIFHFLVSLGCFFAFI